MSNYVITGANSEIGIALTHHLQKKGHKVLLISRSPLTLDPKENLSWIDGIDLTSEDKLKQAAQKVAQSYQEPFNLIHSVGDFWAHKSITNTRFEEARSLILSHYLTLFGVAKYLIPIMRQNGGGRIIAFSCNSVKYNYPDMAAFTSSKAAVECLIKCIANEQSQYGITANAFALPSIATEHVKATKPKEYWGQYVTLDELTDCIEATIENLSSLVNGTVINLFKYSWSFYHSSYYNRNKIWEDRNEE